MSRLEEKLTKWVFSPDYLNISPAQFVVVTVIVPLFVLLLPVLVPSTVGLFPRIAIVFLVGVFVLTYSFLFIFPPWAGFLLSLPMFICALGKLFPPEAGMVIMGLIIAEMGLIGSFPLFYLVFVPTAFVFIASPEARAWFKQVNMLHREAKRCTRRCNVHEALKKHEQLLEAYVEAPEAPIGGFFESTAFFYRNVFSTLLWIADKDSRRALDCILYLTRVVEPKRRYVEHVLEVPLHTELWYLVYLLLQILESFTNYSSLYQAFGPLQIEQIQEAVFEALVRILRDTEMSSHRVVLSLAETVSTATPVHRFCQKVERADTLQIRDALLAIYEAYVPLFRVAGLEKVRPKKTQWRKAAEFLRLVSKLEQEEQQEDAWEEALGKLTALQQMEYGREIVALYSIVACLARLQFPLSPEEISKCMDKLDVLRGQAKLLLKDKVRVLEQLRHVAEDWTRCERIASSVGRRACYADIRKELDKISSQVLPGQWGVLLDGIVISDFRKLSPTGGTGPSGALFGRIVKQWRDEIDQRITVPAVALDRGVNPYIAGDAIRESDMFFGREEALAEVLDTIHNNHVAIYGERRIGKTSLLHQLDNRLRGLEDPQYLFIPAFVNLQGVPAERLFYTLMSAIARSCQPRIGPLNLIHATKKEGYDADDLVDDLETVLEALGATTDKQIRLVLLLDEGDELNRYDPKVQARLRGVFMTRAGRYLRMVWSGLSIDKEWKLDTSPWYNLFAIEIRLAPFTREEALRLIQEPVKGIYRYDEDAIELILQYSERKPFRVQQICLATINRVLAQKRREVTGPIRVTKEDVERAYQGPAAEEAISSEVEERGKVGLLEKQVAEGRAEYQVNTDGQGDQ